MQNTEVAEGFFTSTVIDILDQHTYIYTQFGFLLAINKGLSSLRILSQQEEAQ